MENKTETTPHRSANDFDNRLPSSIPPQNHVDSFQRDFENGSAVIELNVGGVVYATTRSTLTSEPNSLLSELFTPRRSSSIISQAKQHFFQKSPGVGNISDSTSKFNFPFQAKHRSPEPQNHQVKPVALEDQPPISLSRDARGRYFIDRDGVLFRFVLDYLRSGKLLLPDCFLEGSRLRQEAEFYRLNGMLNQLNPGNFSTPSFNNSVSSEDQQSLTVLSFQNQNRELSSSQTTLSKSKVSTSLSRDPGFIVVGYRGTFAFGRDGCQADVKFRKMWRILVSGKVALCREVFKDTLNESRDVDRGTTDRYTSRFFLKHTFLEQAFDMLQEAGFRMVASCGSGTNSAGGDLKPGMDLEESKWNHYNEFVFCRE